MTTTEITLAEYYNQFHKMVYNTALSYLQNIEDAEEITQDVFLELHHSIAGFRAESSLETWIYRITINKSLDLLKYRKRKKRFGIFNSINLDQSAPLKIPESDFHHPGVVLENKEKAAILFKAIDTLPEIQKTVFILSKVEGLGNIEIGEIIKKTVGAVESLNSRARENLKKELFDYYKQN